MGTNIAIIVGKSLPLRIILIDFIFFMKKYILLLAAILLMAACDKDANNDNGTPDDTNIAERTVLIYMAADNNLSWLAANDLEEMKEGSLSLNKQQNLVVYVDMPDMKSSYIARIKDGEVVDSTVVSDGNSADPAVLEKMMRYTCEKYPAKSYGLGLWGHATGWTIKNDTVVYAATRAYGIDTGDYTSYWMNIPSMARAISNGLGNEHLRFIFADCCNFACIESAYELRNVTDYLIGSPAEIPDPGAPYHLIIPQLFNTSDTFYQKVIDTYYDFYIDDIKARPNYYYNENSGDLAGYSVPLSVIKSSELDNLAQATAQLLSTIHSKLVPGGDMSYNGALLYAYYGTIKYAYDMYYTLNMNTAQTDFDTWKSAFTKAVPYCRFSQKWLTQSTNLIYDMNHFNITSNECGVVSMFFPGNTYQIINPNWNLAIQRFQWNNVIRWQQYGW